MIAHNFCTAEYFSEAAEATCRGLPTPKAGEGSFTGLYFFGFAPCRRTLARLSPCTEVLVQLEVQ